MEEVVRQLGVSDATYYKWRKEYGGLQIDQAKRYKELEQENMPYTEDTYSHDLFPQVLHFIIELVNS